MCSRKLGIHAFNVFNCSRLEIQHKLVKQKRIISQLTKIQSRSSEVGLNHELKTQFSGCKFLYLSSSSATLFSIQGQGPRKGVHQPYHS